MVRERVACDYTIRTANGTQQLTSISVNECTSIARNLVNRTYIRIRSFVQLESLVEGNPNTLGLNGLDVDQVNHIDMIGSELKSDAISMFTAMIRLLPPRRQIRYTNSLLHMRDWVDSETEALQNLPVQQVLALMQNVLHDVDLDEIDDDEDTSEWGTLEPSADQPFIDEPRDEMDMMIEGMGQMVIHGRN